MLTAAQMYAVCHRHPRILSRTARSFVWLYETYIKTFDTFGPNSPHAKAWYKLAINTASSPLTQRFAERLLMCERVGAYLNDDDKHDCTRCKLGNCRWRDRTDRGIHCPKNTYGEWIHRPPQVI